MTHALTPLRACALTLLVTLASPAAAQVPCYADYKAKQDAPLRLHYGVAAIDGPCTLDAAEDELSERLNDAGWKLLAILDIFDDTGLAERMDSAGEYFLRF